MLRVVAHKSAAAAHKYYAEGLRREDYYSEGQEVAGKWHGKAAEILGLSGDVTPEAFAALVENRHPGTGERLTMRMKGERVVGHDFNFHAPKSLSVLHAFTKDPDILKAFRAAVAETMTEFEGMAETRVRKKGAQENRQTGNLAWAEFLHFTARPVSGIPDPHLHAHCFVMNVTHDGVEDRWKAVKFRNLKAEAPYFEAVFHSRLAAKMVELGYGVERNRLGWDIAGIPREVVEKFSRRTAEIERLAIEKGITDPKAKDGLGAASREGKRHGLTMTDLSAAWDVRLTPEERDSIFKVQSGRGRHPAPRERITPEKALDEACEKLFAKASVVPVNRLVAEGLRFGVGQVTPEKVWKEFGRREMIVKKVDGRLLCTSDEVLAEEIFLIDFARNGRGKCAPLAEKHHFRNTSLSEEGREAVRHLLECRDQVMAIRGGAGVGKTTLMKEAVPAIEAAGVKVFAFAPSASASRDTLRGAGFNNAETVAHLLANKNLQLKTRGQVIWIDEAGQIGMRDMLEIIRILGPSTRLILTGDTAQHTPVPRGDSFRLMLKYSELKVAEITEIRRQEPGAYRHAVAALSKGDLQTAFRHLDSLGAIREIKNDGERYRQLAHDFVALSRKDSIPLVVSPTHGEGAKVTTAIRDAKREAGKLGPDKSFTRLQNLQWEEPDKRRVENYHAGLVVQFHQNVHGIQRGDVFRIVGLDKSGGVKALNGKGKEMPLPLDAANRFQVFEERHIALAAGDRIRITHGGKSADGRRLNNGDAFSIEKFSRDGKIILTTGAVLDAKHGHLTYGYCQTSHSSQSKSVGDVLVAQSADSFLAASREQFYVSVSRGKQTISIYTDSRSELQKAVGNSSLREAGVEFAGITQRQMSESLDKWRSMVKSRRDDGAKSHEQALLEARKMAGKVMPEGIGFKERLAIQRGNAGPDGKSRSKGTNSAPQKKFGNIAERYRSYLRGTQPKTAHVNGAKPKIEPKQSRLARGLEASKQRLRKTTAKLKGGVQTLKAKGSRMLPKSDSVKSAARVLKQRFKAARQKMQTRAKVTKKTPTPTMRRGR
jgi:conjugative relaxase-like TrwC/TraI family protein